MRINHLLYTASFLLLFSSCDESGDNDSDAQSASRHPSNIIQILSPEEGVEIYEEKEIPYKVQLSDSAAVENLIISFDNKILTTKEGKIDVASIPLGEHALRVKAKLKDGRVEVKSVGVVKFSDQIPEEMTYRIINTYPHNTNDYIQGFEVYDGIVYEGTGLRGQSVLKVWELNSSTVLQEKQLEDNFFGEGITVLGDKIYQLSWESHTGFVYDKKTLARINTFNYPEEGWGLTNDGTYLIMSDGTNVLTYLDPITFELVKTVQVFDDLTGVYDLNELEFVAGNIYANVYRTNLIVVIEAATGKVKSRIDLTDILKNVKVEGKVDVLNGIAFDNTTQKFYVTGKLWPAIFEVKFLPKEGM